MSESRPLHVNVTIGGGEWLNFQCADCGQHVCAGFLGYDTAVPTMKLVCNGCATETRLKLALPALPSEGFHP